MAGERILVVDDGADMREFVVKYVLKPNGYEYLEARDGLEGFDQIVSGSPDLVLLDLQMPRLDGIGLLRKMQESEINLPVVLMTFYGSEEIAIEVFRLGVKDYVIKPFTEEELLAAIERALMVSRLRREREELTERLAIASRDFQRRVRDLQGLTRLGRLVTSQPDASVLMVRVLEAAAYLCSAERAALLLIGDDGRTLIQRAGKLDSKPFLTNEVVEHPLAWQAMQGGQPVAGPPQRDLTSGIRVVPLCAPLLARGVAVGALCITVLAESTSEHQLQLLGALADYASIGLEMARMAAALGIA